ncbi:MAG: hypothetical protein CL677_07265, partial [Bdellovibrionaceae bacterium]|nr:hypothetical protein [Pseudobdellovibrionaceae bacterium]
LNDKNFAENKDTYCSQYGAVQAQIDSFELMKKGLELKEKFMWAFAGGMGMATAIEMNGVFEHPERLFERVFIEGQKFKGDTTKDFMILDQNLKSIANHTIDSRVLLPHEALRLLKFGEYLDEQIKNIQVSSGDIPMIPGPWILRAEQAPTIEVPHRHQRNPFYQNRIAFSLVKSEMGAGSILRDQETPEGTLLMLTEGGRNGFFNRFELNPVTGRMEGPQHGSGWDGKNRLLLLRQYYYP